jgi:hypothetical protein
LNFQPRKPLIFGLVQPISGIFSHDTYPAFWRSAGPLDAERNGSLKKIPGTRQTATVETSQGCSSFSRQTRRGKIKSVLIRFLWLRQCILRCSLSR